MFAEHIFPMLRHVVYIE